MNYTPEQLRLCADAKEAIDKGLPAEQMNAIYTEGKWREYTGQFYIAEGWLYRPKPVPKTRPWSKPDDVPGPIVWVRGNERDWPALIIMVQDDGMWAMSSTSKNLELYGWDDSVTWQYSTDRKTWLPCEVTE